MFCERVQASRKCVQLNLGCCGHGSLQEIVYLHSEISRVSDLIQLLKPQALSKQKLHSSKLNHLDEAIQLDFDLGVSTVRGSSHQRNYDCRLLRVSSNAREHTLFTVSASSADELFSLKVKIIEFGQKGSVAVGAAVWAIL
jgi:hypothetical protein